MQINTIKNYALYGAIILYACFSNPTPDVLSLAEYVVGILLLCSVGFIGTWNALSARGLPLPLNYTRGFFAYMMIVPLAIGIISANAPTDIIRDIIPILFLILPLALHNRDVDFLVPITATAGGIFALRYCAPFIPQISFLQNSGDLLYLANSPFVPFAAIIGFAWLSHPEKILFSKRLSGLCIMIITFTAMAIMLQRAPIILTSLACLVLLALRSLHRPMHSMVIGAIIMACLYPVFPIIIDLTQSMIDKTMSVGMNNRLEEFNAVLNQSTLFGEGWGVVWKSPAVADMWVRFTHNIISYYWLKAGIVGAILAIFFIGFWGYIILKIIRTNPAIGLAIAVPFIIHITLYTGFKTLDFGCLLALCGACPKNQNQS